MPERSCMELISHIEETAASVVQLQITADDGSTEKKCVSLQDYISLLQSSAVSGGSFGIRLGRIPNGCFEVSVNSTETWTFACTIILPEGTYPMRFEETDYMVPTPPMVFFFGVSKGRVTDSRVFVIRDAIASGESRLCHYPFGNVYSSGTCGRICWGGNSLPQIKQIGELDQLVSLFLGSPTNSDLYVPQDQFVTPPEYVANLRAFYETLSKMEAFPKEILKETGMSVSELMGE